MLPEGYKPFAFYGNLIGAQKSDNTKYKISITGITSTGYGGVFTQLYGEVKNIAFSGTVSGVRPVGTIAGEAMTGSIIENCVSDATVTATNQRCGGLVGQANSKSIISNCVFSGTVNGTTHTGGIVGYLNDGQVINCSTTSSASVNGDKYLGGMVGYATSPEIKGCINNATISSVSGTSAGILGYNDATAGTSVTECKNFGNVSSSGAASTLVAGIIGQIKDTSAEISLNANHGSITSAYRQSAGIVGSNTGADITKCVNSGKISAAAYASGIVFIMTAGTVSDCLNAGEVVSTGNSVVCGIIATGASGVNITSNINSGKLTSKAVYAYPIGDYSAKGAVCTYTDNYYTTPDTAYTNLISNTTEISDSEWETYIINNQLPSGISDDVWEYIELSETNKYSLPQLKNNPSNADYQLVIDTTNYGGGDGSEKRPYIIANANHFANISLNPSAHYVLTKDEIEITEPVTTFSGIFNGNNKTVILNIEKETDRVGLFGTITGGAKISSLILRGSVKGKNSVGSLVGIAEGTTKNVSLIENITNYATVNGIAQVGGIIGQNNTSGSAGYTALINCHNREDVTGASYVGGIVGANYHTATNCSNTGNIEGSLSGGISGIAYGVIRNCYNTGNISSNSATSPSGGISGQVRNAVAYIDTCYNLGIISAPLAAGITSSTVHTNSAVKILNSFNAGAVLRTDGTQPVYKLLSNGITATIENVYYLSKTAYDDGDAATTNITTLDELKNLSLAGFTSGGSYPVITENEQTETDPFLSVSTKLEGNGTANLFWYGPFIDIYVLNGTDVEIAVTADEGYTASIYVNDIPCKEKLPANKKYTYNTSPLTSDVYVYVLFKEIPEATEDEIILNIAPTVFIPEMEKPESIQAKDSEGNEYTYIADPRFNYGAVFVKLESYYGWTPVEYGLDINGVKYPSYTVLSDKLSFGILLKGVDADISVIPYATYKRLSDGTMTTKYGKTVTIGR